MARTLLSYDFRTKNLKILKEELGDMFIKCWGFILLTVFTVSAANFDLHFRPKSPLKNVKKELGELEVRKPAETDSMLNESIEIRKRWLRNRIEWLEVMNKYVYHKSNGRKIFPYEAKIKALKKLLKELEGDEQL